MRSTPTLFVLCLVAGATACTGADGPSPVDPLDASAADATASDAATPRDASPSRDAPAADAGPPASGCDNAGCGPPPFCGEPCSSSCGCCGCAPGAVIARGGAPYVCAGSGACYEPARDGGSGACAATTREACQAASGCFAVTAWDHTGRADGGRCWASNPVSNDRVFVRCIPSPQGGTADYVLAAEPGTGRCLGFPSGSLVPSGWARCPAVMPACGR